MRSPVYELQKKQFINLMLYVYDNFQRDLNLFIDRQVDFVFVFYKYSLPYSLSYLQHIFYTLVVYLSSVRCPNVRFLMGTAEYLRTIFINHRKIEYNRFLMSIQPIIIDITKYSIYKSTEKAL